MERRGLSRPLAALAALLIVALAAVGLLVFIIPGLWEQSIAVGQNLMAYFTPENAARQRAAVRRYSPALERMAGEGVEHFIRDPSSVVGSPSTWFAGGLSSFFQTATAAVDLLLVPCFVYYILVDFSAWGAIPVKSSSLRDFSTHSGACLMRWGGSFRRTFAGSC